MKKFALYGKPGRFSTRGKFSKCVPADYRQSASAGIMFVEVSEDRRERRFWP